MDVSVIITTQNQPRWLEKVLWGFAAQSHGDFEVLIADDGSGPDTAQMIANHRHKDELSITHVWHQPRGIHRSKILNNAIQRATHEYLVFVDGACVPRADFLATHVELSTPGRFLSGGVIRLPSGISRMISEDDVRSGRATDRRWLRKQGVEGKLRLLTPNPSVGGMLDAITTTRPTFNEHNASAWKADILRANGFDERIRHRGLDRELGQRLANAGVRGMQIRHRAGCVQLYSRGDQSRSRQRNNEIRRQTKTLRLERTEYGIDNRKAAA